MKGNRFNRVNQTHRADGARKQGNEDNDITGGEAGISIVAGGIAHDLNTIITTIYGYCELALENIGDPDQLSGNIREILSAADRARLLTGQLLDLSRNANIEKVPVRVADALRETITFITPSVTDRIRIILNIKAADALVMTPPALLFRLFLNLAMNGIQAMDEKGGTLTVTAEYAGEAEQEGVPGKATSVIISFDDTGSGMDDRTADDIFKPFFTSGRKKGTGLGLTVVADAVRELGGKIDFITTPGSGTTFTLLIPVAFFGPLPEKD